MRPALSYVEIEAERIDRFKKIISVSALIIQLLILIVFLTTC